MRTRLGLVVGLCLVLLDVGLAAAQPFHITFRRGPDEPLSLVLAGDLTNDGGRDAVEVWVAAEAMNAQGKIVGRGLAFVTWMLRAHSSASFTVKLPRADDARAFRVTVSSFRYMSPPESP